MGTGKGKERCCPALVLHFRLEGGREERQLSNCGVDFKSSFLFPITVLQEMYNTNYLLQLVMHLGLFTVVVAATMKVEHKQTIA